MKILLFIFLICALFSFLFIKSFQKRKKIFVQFSSSQFQNFEAKKYLKNYIFASIISCFTVLFLFFILFEFRVFFESKNSDFDENKNEIVFLLDVSNSMNANDIILYNAENTRLNAAKKTIYSVLENTYSANFGLVIFAGEAQTVIPISQDKVFANQILETVETNFISNQGTNIELGIETAIQVFSDENQQNKIIILLSDFENHNGNIENAILNLLAKNISIFAIGFGSENGSKIPDGKGEFLRDFKGQNVITSLNFAILQKVSENYFIYPFDLNLLIEQIEISSKKSDIFETNSKLQLLNIFLFLVLLLIILQFIFKT